jgi:hypothetical protein
MEKEVQARMAEISVRLAATQFAVAALFGELADRAPDRARFAADQLAGSGAAALPPAVAKEIESLAEAWRAQLRERDG